MSFAEIPATRLGMLQPVTSVNGWYRTAMWCHLINEPFVANGSICPVCGGDLSNYHPDEGTHEAIGLIVPPWKVGTARQELTPPQYDQTFVRPPDSSGPRFTMLDVRPPTKAPDDLNGAERV